MKNWAGILVFFILVTSCTAVRPATRSTTLDGDTLRQAAAAQATQLVLSAQATAIVFQAQLEATAILNRAKTLQPASQITILAKSEPTTEATDFPMPTSTQVSGDSLIPLATVVTDRVELLGVGLAAEGALVNVQFRAPPDVARRWQQGDVYVTDEKTGEKYIQIAVMPSVGPLFGRPKLPGQIGYVMLVNTNGSLRTGSSVTVTLGDFVQQHIVVQ